MGECEKSTGSSRRASGSDSPGFGKSPGTAKDALRTPHPCSSPLHLGRQSDATPKRAGHMGHPPLLSAVPTLGSRPGSNAKGSPGVRGCEGGSASGKPSWHRACWGAEPPTHTGGGRPCPRVPVEAPSVSVASSACGDLPFRKEQKRKNAVAYPLHAENNKPLGDGVCEFSLNCFISNRTATPPRLSSRQSGSFASSPGGMGIRYYNELFLKYVLFISSPARFRSVLSWRDRRVCEFGERGAGRRWWNCSRRRRSPHCSRREFPARRWAWLPLPFMFPATG